jgi:uncharacterized SAM-dependent methyltransferase
MYQYVQCFGLWGCFDDALAWSRRVDSPKWFLSLGSIFGNDHFGPAVAHLSTWAAEMRPQDRMLLGMDAHEDIQKIWNSYHDNDGFFEQFIRNGLAYSNEVLDHRWFRDEDWEIDGVTQDEPVMHKFVIRAVRDIEFKPLGMRFSAGDEIDCYEGFKYGPVAMRKQFALAGLEERAIWKAPCSPICKFFCPNPRKPA